MKKESLLFEHKKDKLKRYDFEKEFYPQVKQGSLWGKNLRTLNLWSVKKILER